MFIKDGSLTPVGIATVVVASAAAAIAVDRLFFQNNDDLNKEIENLKSERDAGKEMAAKLFYENQQIKATTEVEKAKLELIGLTLDKRSAAIKEQEESFSKKVQDYESDLKALRAMEKRLKLEVQKA